MSSRLRTRCFCVCENIVEKEFKNKAVADLEFPMGGGTTLKQRPSTIYNT